MKLREGVRIEFGASADDTATARFRDGALPLGASTPALREAVSYTLYKLGIE